ncbi:hypothetical protein K7432_005319 [Basidiobolus ranarum]|uniref:RING-type E3 ubiquitin transferase n=1 Tax=Basidiobolus ranarum TaxID=34480 RepID=A0ABR2W3C7_9FUNG
MSVQLDLLQCPICLDIVNKPRETLCCHQLLCLDHISQLQRCPSCRYQPLRVQCNVLAERLIGIQPVDCPFGCTENVIRSNLSEHKRICQQRPFSCPFHSCSETSFTKEPNEHFGILAFKNHLMDKHGDLILERLHLLTEESNLFQSTSIRNLEPVSDRSHMQDKHPDPIAPRYNSRGIVARLGINGKYYCGQALPGFCCPNCDGHCGPGNGCNCPDCMKHDVEARRLPYRSLVNREGFTARRSDAIFRFYCGRKVLDGYADSDGHCGPTVGPNCDSCALLDRQALSLYANLNPR